MQRTEPVSMTTKNLLLVTYHFPPSAACGAYRMLGFARHLPPHGWRVQVVAPPETPWDPVDPALAEQIPSGTAYHAVPYPRAFGRLLRRTVPYAQWLPFAWQACRRVIAQERPDVIVTSGPPHIVHLLGLLLKRTHRLPWVADFRDPWISGNESPRHSLRQEWLRFWEKRVVRRADRIIANTPNAAAMFQTVYARQAAKIVSVTNGFDPPAASPAAPRFSGTVRLLHAGEIYDGRNPLPLLDAMAEGKRLALPGDPTLKLELMGNIHLSGVNLDAEVARRGLTGDVQTSEHVPYKQALQEMAQSDLLLLLDAPGRKVTVPAKLYEYFGMGRPVLALTDPHGAVARIVGESGLLHRVAAPDDVAGIRRALSELTNALATEAPAVPDRERLQRFTRAHLAGAMAEILGQVVEEGGRNATAPRACLA